MTKDELKKKLRSAQTLSKLLEADIAELQNMRDYAEKITPAYSLAPGGNSTGQRIENDTAKIVDLENTIKSDQERLKKAIEEVKQLIGLVDDPLLSRILYKRYLQYKKWEQIAVDLNYTYRRVLQLHGIGLNEIMKRFHIVS